MVDKPADKARLAAILSKITTGNPEAPWRIVIYGQRGVGKSTWASHCPKIAMIPFEEGVNQLRVKQFPQVQSWPEFHDTLDALLHGDHEYQAVGLDGVDTARTRPRLALCGSVRVRRLDIWMR